MAATIATVAATAGANETATTAPTAAETGAAAAGTTTAGDRDLLSYACRLHASKRYAPSSVTAS